jgi:ribosomal subunit interface protein
MKIDITTKNIELDNPLRVFIEEKIGGLEHVIGDSTAEARVEIGKPSKHHQSGPVFYAEANIKLGGTLLRAEKQHEDLRAAIVDVKDALQIQIAKFKEKHRDH